MSLLDKRFACLSTPPPQVSPVITLHPQNVTVDEGVPWNISSAATGATSSEWYKDGSPTGNTTDVFSGLGLASESGSYFNRYSNAIGDTDTNNSLVNITPSGRVFIDLAPTMLSFYSGFAWSPTTSFNISFKYAHTLSGSGDWFTLGQFRARIVNEQFIVIHPDNSGSGGTISYNLATPLNIGDLNEIVITGDTGSTLVSVQVNGASIPPASSSTDSPTFGGVNVIGSTSSGSASPEMIIADFKAEDTSTPSNTLTFLLDQQTGNTETAVEGGVTITYTGILEGLPTREFFTLVANQWVGDNGTVLTIAY